MAFERSGSFLSRIERIVAPPLVPRHTRAADVGAREEDSAERELEAVVAAGDESRDAPDARCTRPATIPSAADIQRLVSGLTIQRTAAGRLVVEAPPETAATLAALFSGMAQLFQAAAASAVARGDQSRRR